MVTAVAILADKSIGHVRSTGANDVMNLTKGTIDMYLVI